DAEGKWCEPPALAHPGKRLVHRNPDQPGAELRLAAELPEMRERAGVGLLQHVLGLGVVVQNGTRRPEQTLVVAAPAALQQGRLAGQDAVDQRVVGLFSVYGWRGLEHRASYQRSRRGSKGDGEFPVTPCRLMTLVNNHAQPYAGRGARDDRPLFRLRLPGKGG